MRLTLASPEIVSRLPKSTMSVRTITYLNDPEILKESTLTPSNGREHAVVVGISFLRSISNLKLAEHSIIFIPDIKYYLVLQHSSLHGDSYVV